MSNDTGSYTWRGIWTCVIIGLCLIAFASGCQAAFAPTVRITCPARSSAAAPNCEMQWLVAFDRIPARTTPLPGLRSAGEIESTSPGSRRGPSRSQNHAFTMYLQTAAGPVRTIMWGDQMELQWFRGPIVKYLENAQAPPLDVTMWPSSHPMRMVANVIVAVGLLFWVWLPAQIVVALRRSLQRG